jgi:hypothetical protein
MTRADLIGMNLSEMQRRYRLNATNAMQLQDDIREALAALPPPAQIEMALARDLERQERGWPEAQRLPLLVAELKNLLRTLSTPAQTGSPK